MYNGVGLTTPRGSGTNGHVVRNLSHHQHNVERAAALMVKPPKNYAPDPAILEHERKRRIEIQCYELQVELEDKGMDNDAIKENVDSLRNLLLKNLSSLEPSAEELELTDTDGQKRRSSTKWLKSWARGPIILKEMSLITNNNKCQTNW